METGPQTDEARLGEAAKWLAGSIPVAVAALTLAGVSGNELGRVIRMYPAWFIFGVVALIFAVVAGVISLLYATDHARKWLTLGLIAFAVGVVVLTGSHAAATSTQDRPTITARLERDAQGLTAKITVSADGLKSDDYVFVVVQGQNCRATPRP